MKSTHFDWLAPCGVALCLVLAQVPLAVAGRLECNAGGERVSVGLFRFRPPRSLTVSSRAALIVDAGGAPRRLPAGALLRLEVRQGQVAAVWHGRFRAAPRVTLRGPAPLAIAAEGVAARRYAGELVVTVDHGALLPVLWLPLEDYVEAVVGDEMPPDWPAAALEAQGICVRSYTLSRQNQTGHGNFAFCDLTHCQRFRGLAGHDSRVAAAIRRHGLVICRESVGASGVGRPAEALWHATCGGHLAPNEMVFGGSPRAYLRGGEDLDPAGRPWCQDSPHAGTWKASYTGARLVQALRDQGCLGPRETLRGLAVTQRSATGVALAVEVRGDHPRHWTGYGLWMALGPRFGWGEIKSPAYDISLRDGRYTFVGRGLGHGVGLCQWGARGRALAGQSAAQILAAYFPHTRLAN